ncbi:amidohydrolase family protein [Rhizorhabdus dicambivorans]|uniref:Amidohydrolase n=1 Tax=Rhizorhabdus dicambivorans TaxID=1850238 RepID=A0A2A4FYS2_9SPHN|nr:amidohydrolase family protein [Rhizorhabdus dicambivorans]ATE63191.1 amidohydrolase [Rhizorhabdus dicambivorans]PCE43368.1 amidohydrolase [Rhizorhabdus dicambivorans]
MTTIADPIADIMDLDSHEMVPMHMWADMFGQRAADLVAPLAGGLISRAGANATVRDDIKADDAPIDYDSVWNRKGADTPSAIDLRRRPAVMDMMGVKRQFVFPTFALIGLNLYHNPAAAQVFGFDPAKVDAREAGQAAIDGYNDWAIDLVKSVDGSRMRPVAVVRGDSVDDLLAQAKRAIAGGLRGLWIPTVPPAGLSPAHAALDPFWDLAQASDVPVLLHLGTEFAFASPAWYSDVPLFSYGAKSSLEFPVEPFRASTLHFAVEAFLGAMILGGVFERFPRLRFGVIECGSHWVAPFADALDMWCTQFDRRLTDVLKLKPSEYLARSVRVTPYHFEPVDEQIERNPHLAPVYAYGSDFPHLEGGQDSKRVMEERIARLGRDAIERFFVTNGALLLPD